MKYLTRILAAWLLLASASLAQGMIHGGGIIGGNIGARVGQPAGVYVPAYATDFAGEQEWYVYFRNCDALATGYRATLGLKENVHVLRLIEEGTARPAWYPSVTADKTNGTTLTSGGGVNYYTFNASADWIEWDVPSDADGADTLIVTVVGVVGGGELDIVVNAGEATEATIGTVETNHTGTEYRLERTVGISGSELAAGQTIRFQWPSGESDNSRIAGFYAYDSDGESKTGSFALPASSHVSADQTSSEFAYNIGGSGDTNKWIGGYAHQGGTNQTEINVVETWTKDGSAWTPVVGWTAGLFTLNRTSDVDYDGTPTVIGSVDYTYTFAGTRIGCTNTFTASVDCNTGTQYPAMWPGDHTYTTAITNLGETLACAPQDDGNADAATPATTTGIAVESTPAGALAIAEVSATDAITRMFNWRTATMDKHYWQTAKALGNGESIGGTWWYQFRAGSASADKARVIRP